MEVINKHPQVSVIVPAYNIEKFISTAIQSVLNQTLRDFELILINDGSTDDTKSVIKNFIEDSRIIVIDQPQNLGASAARNAGLNIARGEYLFFLDGDDWIESSALQTYYDLAQESNADILVFEDSSRITSINHLKNILNSSIHSNLWSKFYKRSLWANNEIFFPIDIRIGEDLIANVYLFYYAKNIKYNNSKLYHYNYRGESLSNTYNENMNDIYNALDYIEKFLCDKGVFDIYFQEFEFLKFLHTYYFQVMVHTWNFKIHKRNYDKSIFALKTYLVNPYVIDYINKLPKSERNTFWLFHKSFYLGKFIFLIKKLRLLFF